MHVWFIEQCPTKVGVEPGPSLSLLSCSTYRDATIILKGGGCSGLVVEYRTRNQEFAGSTHTRSSASNLE